MQLPPELDWSYVKSSGLLICRVVDAKLSKKKKGEGELVTLKLNNTINGKNIVFYFHSTHRDLLLASVGKTAKLVVAESGDFLHVSEVLEVDGQKIETPSEQAETQARLLASTLEFTEEELRELFSRYCNSSWVETLAKLQAEKVRREEMVPA
jgi:translation elongation factor P/translation initiation factor 5A